MKQLIALATVLVCAFWWCAEPVVEHGPGVLAPQAPLQSAPVRPTFQRGRFELTPVARFEVEARVLGRKDYLVDTEAELSPLDLALGWGRMSDAAVLDHLKISQGGRFYRWRARELPIPRREIESHSANMHLVPDGADVAEQLDTIREGQIVRLEGHLVDAQRDDGWRWRTSRRRTDTGRGACELILVERVFFL